MTNKEQEILQIRQHDLRSPKGSRKQPIRYGRGNGSGRGTYSGRGMKGQKSRSGPGQRTGLEGWQLPWIKGMPKIRGFKRPFATRYSIVNLEDLEQRFASDELVNPEALLRVGLVRGLGDPIKILGNGEITKNITVSVHKLSNTAKTKLISAGCVIEEIPSKYVKRERAGAR